MTSRFGFFHNNFGINTVLELFDVRDDAHGTAVIFDGQQTADGIIKGLWVQGGKTFINKNRIQ